MDAMPERNAIRIARWQGAATAAVSAVSVLASSAIVSSVSTSMGTFTSPSFATGRERS